MNLIGLKARLHGGKDTAFDFLVNRFNGDYGPFQRVGFADKLKLSGMAALGLTQGSDEDTIALANDLKENGVIAVVCAGYGPADPHIISGREFQQWYGTEAHRDIFWREFWVDALLPQPSETFPGSDRWWENQSALKKSFPDVGTLVITDCRFPNEAQRVLGLGGEVWVIDADERLGPLPEDSHESEYPLPERLVTRHVDNNRTLEQFEWNLIAGFEGMTR
jgi:hypothetical protein